MQLRQCEWKNPRRPKAKYQRMTFHISGYVVNDLKIHLSRGIPQRRKLSGTDSALSYTACKKIV